LFHFEAVEDDEVVIKAISTFQYPISIGLVLNPSTPAKVLDQHLGSIQAVMFMGVVPGKQGQQFIPETLKKIKEFKDKNTKHFIEVDGAVNNETLPDLVKAGVDSVCPGSAIFGNKQSPKMNVRIMEEIIKSLT
jgi:ribulose-phosphate 3-epimerase